MDISKLTRARTIFSTLIDGAFEFYFFLLETFPKKELRQATINHNIYASPEPVFTQHKSPLVERYENVIFDPSYNCLFSEDGFLIPESGLWRGPKPGRLIAGTENIPLTTKENIVHEPVIFGGVWFGAHFGHMITESLSRLWPLYLTNLEAKRLPDHYIFFHPARDNGFSRFPETRASRELMDVISRKLKVSFPRERTKFKNIYIPSAESQLGLKASSTFCQTMSKIADELVGPVTANDLNLKMPKNVYLSRSRLKMRRRRILGEKQFESMLHGSGYSTFYPEELSLREQVLLFRNANNIVAPIGSALHSVLFVQCGDLNILNIVENDATNAYKLIDKAVGVNVVYVDAMKRPRFGPFKSRIVKLNRGNVFRAVQEKSFGSRKGCDDC